MKIKQIPIILTLTLFSSVAFSQTCPSQGTIPCESIKSAASLTGSAQQNIDQANDGITSLTKDINSTTSSNVDKITQAAEDTVNTITAGQSATTEAIYNSSTIEIRDKQQLEASLAEQEMRYRHQLESAAIRAESSNFGFDASKEEIDFIVSAVESNKDKKISAIIMMMRQLEDSPEGIFVQRVPDADAGNVENCDVASGQCTYSQKIKPANKLTKFYQQCSQIKKEYQVKQRGNLIKRVVAHNSYSKQAKSVQQTDSIKAAKIEVQEQKKISCSPSDLKVGLCSMNMSEADYQKNLARNIIIPNGNISSSNFLAPQPVGGVGILENLEDEEVMEQLVEESLDRTIPKEDNAPEIVDTYRNSNQLKAAQDFSDNVVNLNLIPNQRASDRDSLNASEYQSMYLSRQAKLSLVKSSFDESVARRVGTKLSEAMAEGALDSEEYDTLEPIKESVNGASLMDHLSEQINSDFERLAVNPDNPEDSSEKFEVDANFDEMMIKSMIAQNKILLMQIQDLEKIELLSASMLAGQINSPENVRFLKELRGEK